jgi:DNA-binding transcriptional ArsR family regulator
MNIQEEIRISDLETLKVIGDPLRMQILERIGLTSDSGELTTVKQLSEDLQLPPTKLYYHIKLLEKHDLIQVAETRLISGIIEKHYQIRARRIRVDLDISQNSELDRNQGMTLTLSSISHMFASAYKNLEHSLQHRMQESDPEDKKTASMLSTQSMMQLSLEQAEDLIAKINELIDAYSGINHLDGLIFGLTILFNPNYHLNLQNREGQSFGSTDFKNPLNVLDDSSVRIPPQL